MVKYTKLYSGGIPSLKEGDIFKTTIPLTKLNSKNNLPINADKTPINLTNNEKIEKIILKYLQKNEYITNTMIKEMFNIKDTKSKIILRKLTEENKIIAFGSNKNRNYKINKQ